MYVCMYVSMTYIYIYTHVCTKLVIRIYIYIYIYIYNESAGHTSTCDTKAGSFFKTLQSNWLTHVIMHGWLWLGWRFDGLQIHHNLVVNGRQKSVWYARQVLYMFVCMYVCMYTLRNHIWYARQVCAASPFKVNISCRVLVCHTLVFENKRSRCECSTNISTTTVEHSTVSGSVAQRSPVRVWVPLSFHCTSLRMRCCA